MGIHRNRRPTSENYFEYYIRFAGPTIFNEENALLYTNLQRRCESNKQGRIATGSTRTDGGSVAEFRSFRAGRVSSPHSHIIKHYFVLWVTLCREVPVYTENYNMLRTRRLILYNNIGVGTTGG